MQKILIANRGEIAVRVIQTAREFGYRTVAVYSDVDADSLHIEEADQAVCIGEATPSKSYLDMSKILEAAKITGADAIHPGYGFLSENANFARACAEAGITFIGPKPDAIELMGSKRLSKLAMIKAGVPCIAGYQGEDQSDDMLSAEAVKIGLPVMVKASAGGGGRGMRLVSKADDLLGHIKSARSEALNAFGSDELILEQAIIHPRHIEIQIFGDDHGNVVHLCERDCSVQRRHQKVIEEAPSPFVDEALRQRMGRAAVDAAKACNYRGAGTVEFLVDAEKNFYFLEMNTRLQVEHPVTEMITGLDLVEWQFIVAEGQALPLAQDEITIEGHAIEVRLYAEDPRHDFLPQTGTIYEWCPPYDLDLRTDSGIQAGQEISPYYDPMIAKLISYGDNRDMALRRLASGLEDCLLLGVNNNKSFLTSVLRHASFRDGDVTTAFLDEKFASDPTMKAGALGIGLIARAALTYYLSGQKNIQGWTSSADPLANFKLEQAGTIYDVALRERDRLYDISCGDQVTSLQMANMDDVVWHVVENGVRDSFYQVIVDGTLYLDDGSGHYIFDNIIDRPATVSGGSSDGQVKAPMEGAIIDVLVAEGDTVSADQVLVVMEAMKMEHSLKAGVAGVVESLPANVGDQVKSRQILARVAPVNEEG